MKTRVLPKGHSSSATRREGVLSPAKSEPTHRHRPPRPPQTVVEALKDDEEWVRQNLDRLIEEHGRVYVAVRDGQVFGTDDDENTLIMRLFRKDPHQGFLVISLDDPTLHGEEGPQEIEPGVIDEDDLE